MLNREFFFFAFVFLAGCLVGFTTPHLPALPTWSRDVNEGYVVLATPAAAPVAVCDERSVVMQNVKTHQIETVTPMNGSLYLCQPWNGK